MHAYTDTQKQTEEPTEAAAGRKKRRSDGPKSPVGTSWSSCLSSQATGRAVQERVPVDVDDNKRLHRYSGPMDGWTDGRTDCTAAGDI